MSTLGTKALPTSGPSSNDPMLTVRSHGSSLGVKRSETETQLPDCNQACPLHCPTNDEPTTQSENRPESPNDSVVIDIEDPAPEIVAEQEAILNDLQNEGEPMCTPIRPAKPAPEEVAMQINFTPSPLPKPKPGPRPIDPQEALPKPKPKPKPAAVNPQEHANVLARLAEMENKLKRQEETFLYFLQEAACPCKDPNTCPCKENCELEYAENVWDPKPDESWNDEHPHLDEDGEVIRKDKTVQRPEPQPHQEPQPRLSRRQRDIAQATWVKCSQDTPKRSGSRQKVEKAKKTSCSSGPFPIKEPQYDTDDDDTPVAYAIGDDFSAPERFQKYASSGSVLGTRTPKNKYTGTPMGYDLAAFSVPDLVKPGPSFQVNAVSGAGASPLPFTPAVPHLGIMNPIALSMAQRQATVPSWDGRTSTWPSFRRAWLALLPALQPSSPIFLLLSFLSCLPSSENKRWSEALQEDSSLTWQIVCDTLDKECLKDTSEFRHRELLELPSCGNSFDALRAWKAAFLRHVSKQDDMSVGESYRLLMSKLHPDMVKKVGEHELRLSRRMFPVRISGAAIPQKFLLVEAKNMQKEGKIRQTISRIKTFTNSVEFCCGSSVDREAWIAQLQGLDTKWSASPLDVSPTHLKLSIDEVFEHLFASYRESEHLADRTSLPSTQPSPAAEISRIESRNNPQESSKGGGKGAGKGGGKGGPMVCYKCRKEGHIAAQCTEVKCYNCGQLGHLSNNCPTKGKGQPSTRTPHRAGTGPICYTCKLLDLPFEHNHLECQKWQEIHKRRARSQQRREQESLQAHPPSGAPPKGN